MARENLYKIVEARLHNYKYIKVEIDNLKLDVELLKKDFIGCKAISYSDDIKNYSNSFYSSVENELVYKEKALRKKVIELEKKEIEKKKIDNALAYLTDIERKFFELYFLKIERNSMMYIAIQLHFADRKSCYQLKNKIILKIMYLLYPRQIEIELPLFSMTNQLN